MAWKFCYLERRMLIVLRVSKAVSKTDSGTSR